MFLISLALLATTQVPPQQEKHSPHILLIYADDLGYGDLKCYNEHSNCPTPRLNRLAEEGMRFTDAHSAAGWCVPSRYALLTGRYPFRTSLNWRKESVIEKGRTTIASLLKSAGYQAACVGKWHLGFDGGSDYDFSKPLAGGPLDVGFDSFFGLPHSLDIEPYYYVRGRLAVAPPTGRAEANSSSDWSPIQGKFWRAGGLAEGFVHEEVLPTLTKEAVAVIRQHAEKKSSPLFLYVALTSPHTPWLPDEKHQGVSEAGLYGDFVAQTDSAVGEILTALEEAKMSENTLVIFTSDNGPVWYDRDEEKFGHASAGPLRGMKGDAFEGGHRMPFVVRWPGKVKPNSVSDATISQTDLLAAFAEILGRELPQAAGEDSYSFLPLLIGKKNLHKRPPVITQSSRGYLAVRQGPWKLIAGLGSGGFTQPSQQPRTPGGPPGQLYNLETDLGETRNVYLENPEIAGELEKILKDARQRGRTR